MDISAALAARRALGLPSADTDAYRLVHAEGEGALTVDVYGAYAVASFYADAVDEVWLDALAPHDEVKFVVCSEDDFRWSREIVRRHRLEGRVHVLFSPVWGRAEPKELARWILESGLDARLSLQVHKVIWGPDVHGV